MECFKGVKTYSMTTLFIQNKASTGRCIACFKTKNWCWSCFTTQPSFTSSWVPQPVSENITSAIKFSLMVTRSIPLGDRNTCVTAALLGAVINLHIHRYPFLVVSPVFANCLNTVSCVVLRVSHWWQMDVNSVNAQFSDHLELNIILNSWIGRYRLQKQTEREREGGRKTNIGR